MVIVVRSGNSLRPSALRSRARLTAELRICPAGLLAPESGGGSKNSLTEVLPHQLETNDILPEL